MTSLSAIGLFAPARRIGGVHVSVTVIVIVVVLVIACVIAIIGWRAPDRSPGADSETERERIDN